MSMGVLSPVDCRCATLMVGALEPPFVVSVSMLGVSGRYLVAKVKYFGRILLIVVESHLPRAEVKAPVHTFLRECLKLEALNLHHWALLKFFDPL